MLKKSQLAKLSPRQTFPLYGMVLEVTEMFVQTLRIFASHPIKTD